MATQVSRENINSLISGRRSFGPDAWRHVSAIRHEGISYAIESLAMWSHLSAKVVEASCLRPSYNSDEADCSRLVVMLAQDDTCVTIGPHRSRRPTPTHDTPFQMSVSAPGSRQFGFFDHPSGYLKWLVLQFDVDKLGQQLGAGFEACDFRPRHMFYDAALYQVARLFEAACRKEDSSETLRDDLLMLSLLTALSRLEKPAEDRPFGLSPTQRRLLVDYMRSRLATNIRLSELCNLVQLSPFHFCRAFKTSLGVSPHVWHTRERVRVAQSMLSDRRMRLADVAHAVGFCDQAHFTKSFRRIVGMPPGAWQRARYG
ncbi:helix-turn-helix domain-containing protein [Ensifer sp. 22564]|uniref:helix-turn-helix domain-containing protein n=1 Tax=Ensifer sp. 22564 TaxID=3453943 RepID=UPI003F84D12D